MSTRKKTVEALKKHVQNSERAKLEAQLKTAGFDGDVQVASEVPKKASGVDNEFGGNLKRDIPKGYEYDTRSIKPLARMLWAMSVALGHAMTAHRQFSKVKSSTVSPDGMIGGKGYVMSVKDVRKALYDACENLSAISDTIHDELNAPHWKPKLAEMERADIEVVERLVGEAEQNMDDPDSVEVNDNMSEAEEEGARVDLDGDGVGEPSSRTPDGEDLADTTEHVKQASVVDRIMKRVANSSVPPDTLPGPRVDHLDRGDVDQTGPGGSYNQDEPRSEDPWGLSDGVDHQYDYRSEWDNDLRNPNMDPQASSRTPDHTTEPTPTAVKDFGFGYDLPEATYDTKNPDGAVYGPASGLPKDPGAETEVDGDTTPAIELEVGRSQTHNAESQVPEILQFDYDSSVGNPPGKVERHEQSQPYIKWDADTHNMRPDYIYQRDVEGPYER